MDDSKDTATVLEITGEQVQQAMDDLRLFFRSGVETKAEACGWATDGPEAEALLNIMLKGFALGCHMGVHAGGIRARIWAEITSAFEDDDGNMTHDISHDVWSMLPHNVIAEGMDVEKALGLAERLAASQQAGKTDA
jgi:hypothetical protein